MNTTNKNFFPSMDVLREEYTKAIETCKMKEEAFWDSLSTAEQLDVFRAVVRRICKAELEDNGTYRHALYGVFKFGPDAYGRGMACGYLDLHNSIQVKDDNLLDNLDGPSQS